MRGVGIGCFWFSSETQNVNEFNDLQITKKNLDSIKLTLEKVDNVSDVEISGIPMPLARRLGRTFDSEKDIPDLLAASIYFKIYMPKRLQEEYGPRSVSFGDRTIEHFGITIKYEFHGPVTYIDTGSVNILPTQVDAFSPSSSVVFIRNYLEEKLDSLGDLKFRYIGPSPFHADIFVEGSSDESDPQERDLAEGQPGYAKFLFSFPGDEDVALSSFKDTFGDTISSFYYAISLKSAAYRYQDSVVSSIGLLLGVEKPRNFIQRFRQNRSRGTQIDVALTSLIADKHNQIELKRFVSSAESSNSVIVRSLFWRRLQSEVSEWPQLPYEEAREVIRIIEERRQKYLENFSTVAAGIISGLIGALVGAGLSFYISKTPQQEKPTTHPALQLPLSNENKNTSGG